MYERVKLLGVLYPCTSLQSLWAVQANVSFPPRLSVGSPPKWRSAAVAAEGSFQKPPNLFTKTKKTFRATGPQVKWSCVERRTTRSWEDSQDIWIINLCRVNTWNLLDMLICWICRDVSEDIKRLKAWSCAKLNWLKASAHVTNPPVG